MHKFYLIYLPPYHSVDISVYFYSFIKKGFIFKEIFIYIQHIFVSVSKVIFVVSSESVLLGVFHCENKYHKILHVVSI